MKKENLILEKSFQFSIHAIELYKKLADANEYVLSKQFLKSSTSIGANVNEATAAQSKADFISKMAIASKEARETKYWLMLLEKSHFISFDFTLLQKEADELINILTAIVKTAQSNHSTLKTQNS